MSTFTIQGILSHPDQREGQRLATDFLVGTRATYMVLPAEIVERLALATPYERTVELATGEIAVYPLGDVRLALSDQEWTTVFLAGPRGSETRLGTVTLAHFGLVADPVNRILVRMPNVFLMSA
jgi:predicted aspartyl protease